uniref:G_PROTEIN_RECEP_F1_2 domain-containing protein n=1 Tax=Gongylonema pulchrum TaxID=637853 RepID=A0A183DEV7_9BILA
LRRSVATYERAWSRTLKVTFVVVIAFLLCWTPYAVASLVHFTIQPSPIPAIIRKLLYAFAVFNSAISPYLYGYFSFDLKKELLLLGNCTSGETQEKGSFSVSASAMFKYNFVFQKSGSPARCESRTRAPVGRAPH